MNFPIIAWTLFLLACSAVARSLSGVNSPYNALAGRDQPGARELKPRDQYVSATWAGASQYITCAGNTYDNLFQVSAQWIIPNISAPTSGPGVWSMLQAVTVDGMPDCTGTVLYCGVYATVTVDDDGASTVAVTGFYQVTPGPIQFFDNFVIEVGHKIGVITNTFGFPPAFSIVNYRIGGGNASVIPPLPLNTTIYNLTGNFVVVNLVSSGGGLLPLPAFDTFIMSQPWASFGQGNCDLDNASFLEMIQNGQTIVKTKVEDSNDLVFLWQ